MIQANVGSDTENLTRCKVGRIWLTRLRKYLQEARLRRHRQQLIIDHRIFSANAAILLVLLARPNDGGPYFMG